MTKFVSINEAAERLLVTRRTLERWISDGRGPIVTQIGARRKAISEDDLADFIASRKRIGVLRSTSAAA
jgi:excisionase family DNA binding protein